MWDVIFLPAMGYVPTEKVRATLFLFPPEPIAIRDPELEHLGGNVQKGYPPGKGIPQELSLGK